MSLVRFRFWAFCYAINYYIIELLQLGIMIISGALAQSVEHLTFNQVVGGSNPPCFTQIFIYNWSTIKILTYHSINLFNKRKYLFCNYMEENL